MALRLEWAPNGRRLNVTPSELDARSLEIPESGMGYSLVTVTLKSGESFPAVLTHFPDRAIVIIPTSEIRTLEAR